MMTEMNGSVSKTTSWASPLTRRKTNASGGGGESDEKLARVLGLLDLTSLGVGSTLGLGVYVLAGKVALYDAGPAVTISFLIAAIASAFAGLCYAELASRVPKAGSAYVYCYVTIGEFAAFVIGWNLILEYAIGTAAMAKALSDYVDFSTNGIISRSLTDFFPMNVSFLAPYLDFFAFTLVLILTALLAWGVKESTRVNNVFTLVNVLTVLIVIVAGVFKANASYWSIPKEAIPANVKGAGEGGFLPFGWSGVFSGAATCFFGYVGFDVIATTGDEAKNPKRNIPLALVISLMIIFMAYFGVATVITMLVPYYSQDEKAPLTKAFSEVGLPVVMWIISIGAMCALCASLLGAIFPLPRILYAMADDGLLFSCFSDVNKYTKTPLKATLISGILTGIFAAVFDLKQLMDMMSIGTLLAYSIVALCILILRYKEDETNIRKPLSSPSVDTSSELKSPVKNIWHTFKISFNLNGIKFPTTCSEKMTLWSLLYFVIFITLLCFTSIYGDKFFGEGVLFYTLMVAFSILCVLSFVIMSRQPQSDTTASFKVPLVPLVPICSISMNIYLMMVLDINTWIRFSIWLAIGFVIYFYYSLDHSVEGKKRRNGNSHIDTSTKM